jgi:hypothetical protein
VSNQQLLHTGVFPQPGGNFLPALELGLPAEQSATDEIKCSMTADPRALESYNRERLTVD